ncbi:hypothetical protein [Mesorhizobium sp. CAU 1741]|uniref:hypothetical protein n=1 Tax=Mesorhizobium sp. CAU 1741 TaxID=3140366 RepID=UPI00325B5821
MKKYPELLSARTLDEASGSRQGQTAKHEAEQRWRTEQVDIGLFREIKLRSLPDFFAHPSCVRVTFVAYRI